jgi:hypothetical protein
MLLLLSTGFLPHSEDGHFHPCCCNIINFIQSVSLYSLRWKAVAIGEENSSPHLGKKHSLSPYQQKISGENPMLRIRDIYPGS